MSLNLNSGCVVSAFNFWLSSPKFKPCFAYFGLSNLVASLTQTLGAWLIPKNKQHELVFLFTELKSLYSNSDIYVWICHPYLRPQKSVYRNIILFNQNLNETIFLSKIICVHRYHAIIE